MKKKAPKEKLTALCESVTNRLGYELCELSLDKEAVGLYIRLYIDQDNGVSLDDCEKVHRAVQPLLESVDYDFLEVCSPGLDRPVKTARDIQKALGTQVDVRLYKALEGQKHFYGLLKQMDGEKVVLVSEGAEKSFSRKDVALVRLVPDLSALESEELNEEDIVEIDG